ncbi:MAG: NAD(P)H-binding protein [Bryobacterales bacterium]|nr:NAD(P)H-binding protein [Bryobacterales bacterium]
MERIALVGAPGAIGLAVAAELERRGERYVALSRSRARMEQVFRTAKLARLAPADLGTHRDAVEALRGVESVLYAVGVPYHQFDLHPKLMRAALEAAIEAGVRRMLVVSSVYSYGSPVTPRVTETHPREPKAFKGRMRREQEDAALDAHKAGRLQTQIVRLPDFYGPGAEQSLAHQIFRAAVRGVPANWLGPVDLPHEFIFVPDAAPVLIDLLFRDDAYGEAWNLGGAGTITGREFMTAAYEAAGAMPRWRTAGRLFLRVAGLFNATMRELVEMQYLQETPVILDDSRLSALLGDLPKTPYAEGIRETVSWMRQ